MVSSSRRRSFYREERQLLLVITSILIPLDVKLSPLLCLRYRSFSHKKRSKLYTSE